MIVFTIQVVKKQLKENEENMLAKNANEKNIQEVYTY